ncbi:MAG: tetratricopeptide repeat protein [Halopseudomonas sp.]|uniref:tetratricopeptide repeat protein n=1 Tax=Halopseudomonas sp. TaxID=2901191 RepID=UPI003002055E
MTSQLSLVLTLFLALTGCGSTAYSKHLSKAYDAYDSGDCAEVISQLSETERLSRSRPYLQPEISLLRGQCLERQALYLDAAQTYRYLVENYPHNEYAYRAGARLETLRQLGHYDPELALPPQTH